jgi:hypothetical protein
MRRVPRYRSSEWLSFWNWPVASENIAGSMNQLLIAMVDASFVREIAALDRRCLRGGRVGGGFVKVPNGDFVQFQWLHSFFRF